MTEQIWIAIITASATCLAAFFGVIVASKMTNYRLCQLEKKVEVHNNAVTRLTILETECKTTVKRVDKLEQLGG